MANILAFEENFDASWVVNGDPVAGAYANSIFSTVTGTGAATFSTLVAKNGTKSMRVVTTATQDKTLLIEPTWQPSMWLSFYFYPVARPAAATIILNWFNGWPNEKIGDLQWLASGALALRSRDPSTAASSTVTSGTSPVLALNQWWRVSIKMIPGTTTGHRMRVYDNDSTTPVHDTGDQPAPTAGEVGFVRFGVISPVAMTYHIDRIRGDNSVEPAGIVTTTAPTVNAGADATVDPFTTVTLTAAAAGGVAPYSYAWSQVAGTPVTLSGGGSGGTSSPVTLNRSVAVAADDGCAAYSTFGAVPAFGSNYGDVNARSFLRFTNLTIPTGSTVTAATITVRSAFADGTLAARLKMQDADNPAAPTTAAQVTAATLTTAQSAIWTSTAAAWGYDLSHTSPDFSAALQAVINRAGWVSGNAVTVFGVDAGSTGAGYFEPQTVTAVPARLDVTYTPPSSGGTAGAATRTYTSPATVNGDTATFRAVATDANNAASAPDDVNVTTTPATLWVKRDNGTWTALNRRGRKTNNTWTGDTTTPPVVVDEPPPQTSAPKYWSPLSPINKPVRANPTLDPYSSSILTAMGTPDQHGPGRFGAAITGFGAALYEATSSTPLVNGNNIIVTEPWGHPFLGMQIPIDPSWKPQAGFRYPDGTLMAGGDDWLTVIGTDKRVYSFWRYSRNASTGQVTCAHGSTGWARQTDIQITAVTGSGTGSGLVTLAGVIRREEIAAWNATGKRLDHALVYATNRARPGQVVYPASKTDASYFVGGGRGWDATNSIPEAQRLYLDPTFNVAAMPGTSFEKLVAYALQSHGAYCVDNQGGTGAGNFSVEVPNSWTDHGNYVATIHDPVYTAAGITSDYPRFTNIPLNRCRIITASNWDSGT